MAIPNDEWIEWIIDSMGVMPIWDQDSIKEVLKIAVDVATESAHASSLEANARLLKQISSRLDELEPSEIPRILDEISREIDKEASKIKQALKDRFE